MKNLLVRLLAAYKTHQVISANMRSIRNNTYLPHSTKY